MKERRAASKFVRRKPLDSASFVSKSKESEAKAKKIGEH